MRSGQQDKGDFSNRAENLNGEANYGNACPVSSQEDEISSPDAQKG